MELTYSGPGITVWGTGTSIEVGLLSYFFGSLVLKWFGFKRDFYQNVFNGCLKNGFISYILIYRDYEMNFIINVIDNIR